MTTILLLVIYLAFIGLGLPDSLFGTAWPAIYTDFSLPIAYGSLVSVTVSAGTIVSSLMSGRLIRKFGTSKVTAFSTLLTALALATVMFVIVYGRRNSETQEMYSRSSKFGTN